MLCLARYNVATSVDSCGINSAAKREEVTIPILRRRIHAMNFVPTDGRPREHSTFEPMGRHGAERNFTMSTAALPQLQRDTAAETKVRVVTSRRIISLLKTYYHGLQTLQNAFPPIGFTVRIWHGLGLHFLFGHWYRPSLS